MTDPNWEDDEEVKDTRQRAPHNTTGRILNKLHSKKRKNQDMDPFCSRVLKNALFAISASHIHKLP